MSVESSPTGVSSVSHRAAIVMMICGVVGFALIAADVVFNGRLRQWDLPVHSAIYDYANVKREYAGELPVAVQAFAAVSALGELSVVTAIAVFVGGVLILKRHWRSLVIWIVALVGSGIINPALKGWFRIPRPRDHTFFSLTGGFTFPSGHTMAVAIAAGTLAAILSHHLPMSKGRRRSLWIAAGLLAVLEAFALMYVGVHYLTDVTGALCVSLAWVGVMRWFLPPAGQTLNEPQMNTNEHH